LYFKGVPASLPPWAFILHLAEMYNIPPWQVEAECTQEWYGYMREWQEAKKAQVKQNG